jgi:dUTP pyrophosphatase
MLVNIKKLVPEAVLPLYAKVGDAGMDLVATSVDYSNEYYIEYGTGLAVEIPEGYVGLIFPRSSNSKKDLQLCNSVGVIDSGYRGEIKLRYRRIINPTPKRNFVVTDVQ